MRAALLILAAALSGFVQALHIETKPGKCHEWLLEVQHHNEKLEHEEHEEHGEHGEHDKHNYKHEMTPNCDYEGNFVPKQCQVFTENDEWCQPSGDCFHFKEGEKWCACVDKLSGLPDISSIIKDGENMNCDGVVNPPCLPGWTYFNEHNYGQCYKFINDPKTWAEAESYCQLVGKDLWGHLASIHGDDTNHFFQKLTLGKEHKFYLTWAGAHNSVAPCFWMWSDGMQFDYEDWFMEDYKFHKNSCLRINYSLNREWSSGACNETLPFICQTETLLWHEHDH